MLDPLFVKIIFDCQLDLIPNHLIIVNLVLGYIAHLLGINSIKWMMERIEQSSWCTVSCYKILVLEFLVAPLVFAKVQHCCSGNYH